MMISKFGFCAEPTPTLLTKRLTLHPFKVGDLSERYVSWLNNPDSVRFSEQRHLHHTPESCQDYLHSIERAGNWLFAIFRNEGRPAHIGNLSVIFDVPNITADMAILIGEPEARACNFGREAWQAVMDHLLLVKDVRKVTAGTMSSNTPMMSLANRCGMDEEGRRKRQCLFEGRAVDMVFFAKFRDNDTLGE